VSYASILSAKLIFVSSEFTKTSLISLLFSIAELNALSGAVPNALKNLGSRGGVAHFRGREKLKEKCTYLCPRLAA